MTEFTGTSHSAAMVKSSRSVDHTFRKAMLKIVGYILLILLAFAFLLPFIWLLSTAFKPQMQVYRIPPVWIPTPITLQNFIDGWNAVPFGTYFMNTVIITVGATLGTVVSGSLVAYGFARFRSKYSPFLFALVLATMMLPAQITMIPTYILFSKLDWINTFKPLIVPAFFGGGAFNIFLLRQFFQSLPFELDEAAKLDGCSSFGIFYKIILPLAKPVLITVTIFSVVAHWNDFMNQLLYLNDDAKYTISVGLQFFQTQYGATQLHLMMAVALLTIVPIIILFFAAQRYFVQGISMTGLKG
jgi:multiple sugar transport system permease protein